MSEILFGDCRDSLRAMAAVGLKVQTCVTSPPYFGLRDYGTGTWEGGDPACEHGVNRWEGEKQTQGAQSGHASNADKLARTECRCGARKVDQQIGLEETPEQYIAQLVEVFRAVREVLADDGTLWVNIGDSYNNNPSTSLIPRAEQGMGTGVFCLPTETQVQARRARPNKAQPLIDAGIKKKDLIGIPWMLAFALRADGWYLRQDIIWHKPNPMPESVTDRCTKAHEYVFLLSKSPRYYFDSEAIKEPAVSTTPPGNKTHRAETAYANGDEHHRTKGGMSSYAEKARARAAAGEAETRNRRSVWTVPTRPYKGAHFAVFPPELIEPCILAGSRPGDTVLDPFMGSATTAAVAIEHGRHFTGCELNPDYKPLQDQRIAEARAARAEAEAEAAWRAAQLTLFAETAA